MHRAARAVMALVGAALVAGACGRQMDARDTAEGVEYTVVLKSTWTRASHPFEYPEAGALTGPHFSGLIGATHNGAYVMFSEGAAPTPGLENLSEQGKHSPLDEEIRAALTAGNAGVLFETGPLKDFGDSLVATVRVDQAHPLVSLAAMVAPSPDWFTGVANVNLMEGGSWVASRTITLDAWDSGGDDGATYKAADRDNNPKKPTMRAASRHFVVDGRPVPVATVTFTRK